MPCDCGCGGVGSCGNWIPPAKCYVCYPKTSSNNCENWDDVTQKLFGGKEQTIKWNELYNKCNGKCAPDSQTLLKFVSDYTNKLLGIGVEKDDAWECSRGSCEYNLPYPFNQNLNYTPFPNNSSKEGWDCNANACRKRC